MKATVDIKETATSRIESRRLCILWWRPSTDRKSVARPRGSVPKRGRPSSRSATHQSCVANRASTHSPYGCALPRAGRPHVEPTDVYSCPSQERGYSARGAREGESKENGELRTVSPSTAPKSKHAVWRRVPRLVTVASGLAHRSAQHLTPLRGRPLGNRGRACPNPVIKAAPVIPAKAGIQRGRASASSSQEAMEREGARKSALTSGLRAWPTNGAMAQPPSHTKR